MWEGVACVHIHVVSERERGGGVRYIRQDIKSESTLLDSRKAEDVGRARQSRGAAVQNVFPKEFVLRRGISSCQTSRKQQKQKWFCRGVGPRYSSDAGGWLVPTPAPHHSLKSPTPAPHHSLKSHLLASVYTAPCSEPRRRSPDALL